MSTEDDALPKLVVGSIRKTDDERAKSFDPDGDGFKAIMEGKSGWSIAIERDCTAILERAGIVMPRPALDAEDMVDELPRDSREREAAGILIAIELARLYADDGNVRMAMEYAARAAFAAHDLRVALWYSAETSNRRAGETAEEKKIAFNELRDALRTDPGLNNTNVYEIATAAQREIELKGFVATKRTIISWYRKAAKGYGIANAFRKGRPPKIK